MSFRRGDYLGSATTKAISTGLAAAGTAILPGVGTALGALLGNVLGGTVGQIGLFGESPQEESARRFDEAAKRLFLYQTRLYSRPSAARSAARRLAAERLRTRMIRAMRR